MFVDASAIVAILCSETDAASLMMKIEATQRKVTSPLAVFEAALAVVRIKRRPLSDARRVVSDLLATSDIRLVPIGQAEGEMALDAFERYGKGRHPARLNMGDCFAYACARTHGVPLLYKGDDFSQTDVASA